MYVYVYAFHEHHVFINLSLVCITLLLPDPRQMIMNGCVEYAKVCGSTRVEAELLPQMWEQISHKYYERRLLVAEACGVLAPYTPVSPLSTTHTAQLYCMHMVHVHAHVHVYSM